LAGAMHYTPKNSIIASCLITITSVHCTVPIHKKKVQHRGLTTRLIGRPGNRRRMEDQLVEKGGRKGYTIERNGRSS